MTLTKSDRTKLIDELKPILFTKKNRSKFIDELKPILFTKDNKNKFKNELLEEMKDVFVTKEEYANALAENNNYLTSTLPTKEEAIADKLEILAAVKELKDEDEAHKQLHRDLGEDVPKLQRQVKHLANELDIELPVNFAF